MAVPRRPELGEDSPEIMDNFHYLGGVISCGGVELVVGDMISCAWSNGGNWRAY